MEMNGPGSIYYVKPLYNSSPTVELPTCMYKINNLYSRASSEESFQAPESTVANTDDEKYQLGIIKRLEDLKTQLLQIKKDLNIPDLEVMQNISFKKQDVVIKANPEYPPYSLWVYQQLLTNVLDVQLVTYTHSSLVNIPEKVKYLSAIKNDTESDLTLSVIWKKTEGKDAEMMVSPVNQGVIEGEVNILRYLSRLLPNSYENDPYLAAQIDSWLEASHSSIVHGTVKDKNTLLKLMNSELGKRNYLVGNSLSIADIIVWSFIRQCEFNMTLPSNVQKWLNNLNSTSAFQLPVMA